MTVTAWRIVQSKYAAHAFDGEGARLYGGRLNSKGVAVVYTAGSVPLAVLEVLVHLQGPDPLARYVLRSARFDEAIVKTLSPADLPKNWRQSPPPRASQRVGDLWAAGARSAVLKVPSAVLPSEDNYLLNPAHPDFKHIVVGPPQPFRFDPRLLRG